jgi:hypothetical protein
MASESPWAMISGVKSHYNCQINKQVIVGSDDSLANFICHLTLHFKHHSGNTEIIFSSKRKQEVLQVVVHNYNCCSMPWTSLQYP